ncbi:SWI/SNF chromatin-remodeling complex subunit [Ciborinia camelliae]|nr:SWI/SNF chromatin-remodeling complex subunit [Ciborinia camelliae]
MRFHRSNASKEGLCPQVIISCYRLRHRWSPKAQSYAQLQKEEFVRRVLDQMIEVHMLVKVSQSDTPSARNLPATVEQSYILGPNCETESCNPGESCDDLLSSEIFRPNQVVFDSSLADNIAREYVSMSELEPNASRFFSPTNTNILGSSTEVQSNKRRRLSGTNGSSSILESSNMGKENQVSSQSPTIVSSAPSHHQGQSMSRNSELANETQANAAKLAQEVANLPWLTQGIQELSERYPDDQYELVYENELLQIRCHDCKGRLYKIHYQNCDVSNMEWHAKSTVHADRVERRIAEAGGEATLTDGVKKRRAALEAAKKTAPHRFRRSQARPVTSIQPAVPTNPAPQHPGATWNASLLREMSQQLRSNGQYQQSPTPGQNPHNAPQEFELDSPSGTPPSPRYTVEETTQNGLPLPRMQQLESRVQSLEQENNAQERTISVLQNKLRTQQQVNNTHQSVIKDLILRVQALEKKDEQREPELSHLKSQIPVLQARADRRDRDDDKVAKRVFNLENGMEVVNGQISHLTSPFAFAEQEESGNGDGDEVDLNAESHTNADMTKRSRGRPRKSFHQ